MNISKVEKFEKELVIKGSKRTVIGKISVLKFSIECIGYNIVGSIGDKVFRSHSDNYDTDIALNYVKKMEEELLLEMTLLSNMVPEESFDGQLEAMGFKTV